MLNASSSFTLRKKDNIVDIREIIPKIKVCSRYLGNRFCVSCAKISFTALGVVRALNITGIIVPKNPIKIEIAVIAAVRASDKLLTFIRLLDGEEKKRNRKHRTAAMVAKKYG